ncbi:MAG: FKBP-type peptidyl-prolyl cis-trans isomerase [Gemmatimonadetes bacterium]|nr:FKBP-type peptidyl-prolyl cis-trans isomerase [Gemmatimonadota bacterium]
MIHTRTGLRPPIVLRAACILVLAVGASTACRESPTTPEPPDIESLDFAPGLGVDVSRMTRLPSGLYIRDLEEGAGARAQPQVGARFNYQGWLHDGTSVDMGVYPANQFSPGAFLSPFDGGVYYQVGSGQTIAAWDLGLEGMRLGGRRQLVVPPRLGFGGAGSSDGRVPGNSVLVYVLELLAVEP